MDSVQIFGHPRGLFVLFLTELWERFSYYGMRAILPLFLIAETTNQNPGLGWTSAQALSLLGTYMMSVYLAAIPGGILADRYLGQKKTVMVGGLILCAGHCILAISSLWAFYTGICLIVLGVGCLKPNITSMVGSLYANGDQRRDMAFTIFYIGINTGALVASLVVGYIGETYNWHYGFGLAGLGMLLGQIVYLLGQKDLQGVGGAPKKQQPHPMTIAHSPTPKTTPLSRQDRHRICAVLVCSAIVIVFWGAFEQAAGLMNIYTQQKINRVIAGFEVPSSWFVGLNPLFILIFGSSVARFWSRRKLKGIEHSSFLKMAIGTGILGLGFAFMVFASMETKLSVSGKASVYWLILAYLFHTVGELCCMPSAMSFVTKVAPAKYSSVLMGLFFAATGLGNKISGEIGKLASTTGELTVFGAICCGCLVFAALIIVFLKPLNALTHGTEAILTDETAPVQNKSA